MWESDTLRAGSAGPGRSEDVMSGKSGKGAAKAVPRAYGRLTGHERDTVQRMLVRGASCREIARELGRSPSTVGAEVSSHGFITAPKPRRGEAGGHRGLPAPGAVARADGGAQRRAGGPVALDHLPLGLGGLRRHDEHGAQAKGRLQAEEARRRPGGHVPLRPQVICRVPRPRGGRVRRGLGDGHRRGRPGGLRVPAHAAAPPQQAAARAAAG
ncbi:hypothetical protein HMPREF9069_00001, partial [Atopobium sp. oral taxon 810 str. F0209]